MPLNKKLTKTPNFYETTAQEMNINVQWMQFLNLEAWNNPRQVDMLFTLINHHIIIYYVLFVTLKHINVGKHNYWIEMITWNHIIICIRVSKSIILDKNTSYDITENDSS